ncbi:short-chain dehydrogenase [Oenococcus oeni IOEB_C23]|uniref:SDR family oxidoreductase n=1 Tax=Oenococcus oeni TaxID=1247 RepID=UPI00050EB22A|nr:SDR family oxidoreductase [Oenococcus oeni]KGH64653.1 short-chain dehydrogenase [Oenococcus oeni IOEB_C23]
MKLTTKKILIVGGTSGFGRELALQVLHAGASVDIIGRNQTHLDGLLALPQVQQLPLHGWQLDASRPEQLQSFFNEHDSYDHLVSTLGGAMGGGFLDNSLAAIRQAIEDKFFVNLQLAQIAATHINSGGSLTLTSGTGGHPSTASGAIIGNQAINLLVKGLAIEMAPHQRVNAVAPTWTVTGLWRDLTPTQLQRQKQNVAAGVPLGRTAQITEVSSAYYYLMTNDFITGQIINVDGGISAM